MSLPSSVSVDGMSGQPYWESPVEKQIREAQERGDFDNLPGAGKPLDLSDAGDPDWWVKRFAAREKLDLGGALPGALALRKEAAGYPESLVDVRTEAQVREIIEDYNTRVLADRLRPAVGNLPPLIARTLDVDEMVERWRPAARRARGAAAPGPRGGGGCPGRRAAAAPVVVAAPSRPLTDAECALPNRPLAVTITGSRDPTHTTSRGATRRKGAHVHSLRTRSGPDCVRGPRSQGPGPAAPAPLLGAHARGAGGRSRCRRAVMAPADALEAAGFDLDFGDDDSGLFLKYLRRGSGYYIDIGASELVAKGAIRLVRGQVDHLTEHAVVLTDGTEFEADAVVYATGYGSMNGWAARLISQDVADAVGKCWGLGSDTTKDPGPWQGELRNMCKPTRQDNLWFHGGNLHQSRHYSRYLAMQLKARMEGIETPVYALAETHHLT